MLIYKYCFILCRFKETPYNDNEAKQNSYVVLRILVMIIDKRWITIHIVCYLKNNIWKGTLPLLFKNIFSAWGGKMARIMLAARGKRQIAGKQWWNKILAKIEKYMLTQNLHCKFRTLSPTGNEAQSWRDGTEVRQEGREGEKGTRELAKAWRWVRIMEDYLSALDAE